MPPVKVWVKNEFLYDFEKGHGEFTRATLLTAKSLPGLSTMFQVLLENGVMRDKLPVSAIMWRKPKSEDKSYQLDYLQIWNNFSYNISFMEINYIAGLRCSVFMKDKTWEKGTIFGTFDWSGESAREVDLSLCEHPDEHKSGHMIELDNGQYAIQPNNRVRVYESSFVTKEFPEKPDYKVCTEFYNVEQADKWVTEDTNKYMYEIEERKK